MTLSPADRLEILELNARYGHAVDRGDVDAVLALFTATGGIEAGGAWVQGREPFAAALAALVSAQPLLRHWTGNHLLQGDGATATHTCYWMTVQVADGQLAVGATGRYEDDLVKTAGTWKFQRRRLHTDWPVPAADSTPQPREG